LVCEKFIASIEILAMLERTHLLRAPTFAGHVNLAAEVWSQAGLSPASDLALCSLEQQPAANPPAQPQVTPRVRIDNQVRAAIQCVLDHPTTAANAMPYPPGIPPLTADQIRRIRDYNTSHRPELIVALRNEIVNFRLQVRQFQLDLVQVTAELNNSAIVTILPAGLRQARQNRLHDRIVTDVEAAIATVIANPDAANDAIPYRNNVPPLDPGDVTEIRNLIANGGNTNDLRDEIVNRRLQEQLPGELRKLLKELLQQEIEAGNFGPFSRATYNQVATMTRQDIFATLQTLDSSGLAFPAGCPVEPPRSDIGNLHVSDELFRALIRRMRPGEPGTAINYQLPALAAGAEITPEHIRQLVNARSWLHDADQVLAPIRLEAQRRALSGQIVSLNQPGWARENYSNVEQWQARATAMVALAQQMRQCAELARMLHSRFPNFSLDGIEEMPPLPERLDVTLENGLLIQAAQAWLKRHGDRVTRQLNLLFAARERHGIFMLGDVAEGPGRINGHNFNRISGDFEVVNGPNGTLLVTPILRYYHHAVPLPRYLTHLGDFLGIQEGLVFTERADTFSCRPDELVFVARNGRVELMRADGLSSWRGWHTAWTVGGDLVNAGIDISMIVMGCVELRAGWVAAGNALRAGRGYRAAAAALGGALRAGSWNLLLGTTTVFDSPIYGDPNAPLRMPVLGWNLRVTGPQVRFARHVAFLTDAVRALSSGRGVGQLAPGPGATTLPQAMTYQEVIRLTPWMRRIEAAVELNFIPALRPGGTIRQLPVVRWLPRNWQGDLMTPALLTVIGSESWQKIKLLSERVWNWYFNLHPADLDPAHMNLREIEQRLRRLQQSPDFFIPITDDLLSHAGLDANQLATFRGIIRDNRADQPNRPLARRRDVEQRLIDRFNRQGATERERLVAAALLLLEASRSTADASTPEYLGNAPEVLGMPIFAFGVGGFRSQTARDYILARFRNSGDPAIRFLAAQLLLSTHGMSPQEYAAFCISLARNNTTPRQIRMQAIVALATYMHTAGAAERVLHSRIASGQANEFHLTAYFSENFGLTRGDLQEVLQSIATQQGTAPDIRALCAACLHAVNLGDSDQIMTQLHSVVDRWNANSNRPAGSFALATVRLWAQDLSLPVSLGHPDRRQNIEKVFMAASALSLLADPLFNQVFLAQRAALVGNAVGDFANPFNNGNVPLLQPPFTVPETPLSAEAINNALLSCVTDDQPDVAVQALQLLLPRMDPFQGRAVVLAVLSCFTDAMPPVVVQTLQRLLPRINLSQWLAADQLLALTPQQITALRVAVMNTLAGLGLDNPRLSEEEKQRRNAARLQIFQMLPGLFASASDAERNTLITELGHTLRVWPGSTLPGTDNPEIRRAAAVALGLLLQGRPAARSFMGDDIATGAIDVLTPMLYPNAPLVSGINQSFVLGDHTPIARLEAAVRYDPSAAVRLAALEALLIANPPTLSGNRSMQQFCTELLVTERDPAILALLRGTEFAERAPDPTSADYQNDFQLGRRDLLLSLNCSGNHSLAGAAQFVLDNCLSAPINIDGLPRSPRVRFLLRVGPNSLGEIAAGTGPRSTQALQALVYIILSGGDPLAYDDRYNLRAEAVGTAVTALSRLDVNVNVAQNPQRALDLLWALEMCLVLRPNMSPSQREALLHAYMRLSMRVYQSNNAAYDIPRLIARAGVILAIILEREFTSSRRTDGDSMRLQIICLHWLNLVRTRAALPVLMLIANPASNQINQLDEWAVTDIQNRARRLVAAYGFDSFVMNPGTPGGPHPQTDVVIFQEQYDRILRQLTDTHNAHRTQLLASFQNHQWFYQNGHSSIFSPEWFAAAPSVQRDFEALITRAERLTSDAAQPQAREQQLQLQREARQALAYLLMTNGQWLTNRHRVAWLRRAAATLADLTALGADGLECLDTVIAAVLIENTMASDRVVRGHLLTALLNLLNRRGIQRSSGVAILAAALQSEYQTMPRPNEPGYAESIQLQIRLLEALETYRHRMSAPIVEAIAIHHPNAEVRSRAQRTFEALLDSVWRIWTRLGQTPPDTTLSPTARAAALRAAINGNSDHDRLVQAIFNAYRGSPILANDPRFQPFMDALSDRRPHVRLAAALVVLRSDNTAFDEQARKTARAVIAHLALHGIHIGLRNSARTILLEMLPNGAYFSPSTGGRAYQIVRTSQGLTIIETLNGRAITLLLTNGQMRREGDGGNPPLLEAIANDPVTSQAFGNFSLRIIAAGLAGPLVDNTVIEYPLITNESDSRRFWFSANPATGLDRIAELYALLDKRNTAVDPITRHLALAELIRLAPAASPEALRQIVWILRHLDPALAADALFQLKALLYDALKAIPNGGNPSDQQRRNINRYLNLILQVARSSPLSADSTTELDRLLRHLSRSPFSDSPLVRQICGVLADSRSGPIISGEDIRLPWLTISHRPLQFAAARDCLLAGSTAVTPEQRRRAIRLLARLAVENYPDSSQSLNLLLVLRGNDLDIALDALFALAVQLQKQIPPDHNKILRCWTLSEQLCQNAHLSPYSERYLHVRIGRLHAEGSPDPRQLAVLEEQLNDCYRQESYDLRMPYSAQAFQHFAVGWHAAVQHYGRDSLEAARAELAFVKAAYHRSISANNLAVAREAAQLALTHARHAYSVLALRLGPNSPESCDALYRLGTIEADTNHVADAISHLNQAMAIYRRNPAVIGRCNGIWIASQLGCAYIRNGDLSAAGRISAELLTMAADPLDSGDRYSVVAALARLADAFGRVPNMPQHRLAEPLLYRALALSETALGQSDPATLELMLKLAQNLAAQGDNAAAVTLMNRAMRLCEQNNSLTRLQRSALYRTYGLVLLQLHREQDAVRAFQHSREWAAPAVAR
jgi:hypothetical protein